MKKYSGIFLITNKISEKQFVGQSSDLLRRWKIICRKALSSPSSPLEKDIAALGVENFDFQVVEYAYPHTLDAKQKKYIAIFNTMEPNGYNRNRGGGYCQ